MRFVPDLTAPATAPRWLVFGPKQRAGQQLPQHSGEVGHLAATQITGIEPHPAEHNQQRLGQCRDVDVGGDFAALDCVVDGPRQKLPTVRTESLSDEFSSG